LITQENANAFRVKNSRLTADLKEAEKPMLELRSIPIQQKLPVFGSLEKNV
jgi:hypothetical protein